MTTKQTATIGKTVYQITAQGTEGEVFFYTIQKGKTEKTLMNLSGDWFLSTGARGAQKDVNPKFSNVLTAI